MSAPRDKLLGPVVACVVEIKIVFEGGSPQQFCLRGKLVRSKSMACSVRQSIPKVFDQNVVFPDTTMNSEAYCFYFAS